MKYLHYFNAVALALALTFALTLGVVSLMYLANLDASPRMRIEWPSVRNVTLVFVVLSVLAGAAFWGQYRHLRWRWGAQAILCAGLVVGALLIRAMVGN